MALSQTQEVALFKGVEAAIRRVLPHLDPKHAGKGAHFRAYEVPDSITCFGDLIPVGDELWVAGNENYDRRKICSLVAAEKTIRLANNNVSKDHVTSRRSRKVEWQRYGGAIILTCSVDGGEYKNYLFALSGLPEDADEAVVLIGPMLAPGWEVLSSSVDVVLWEIRKNKLASAVLAEIQQEREAA